MKRAKKTRVVTFRLDEEMFRRLENAASAAGDDPNNWCRNLTFAELNKGHELTRNERIIFEELSRVRYLLGHGFRLLANDKLTAEEWEKMRSTAEKKPAEIAAVVLTQYRPARAS
jgi:hypothetical protein